MPAPQVLGSAVQQHPPPLSCPNSSVQGHAPEGKSFLPACSSKGGFFFFLVKKKKANKQGSKNKPDDL